jgi:hypothetical protein
MRISRRLRVRLRKHDREFLDTMLSSGRQAGRVVLRGLALGQLHDGTAVSEVAAQVQLTPKAVREMGRRYEESGLDRALSTTSRGQQRQRCWRRASGHVALRWSAAIRPPGRARWSVRLIAAEVVKRH